MALQLFGHSAPTQNEDGPYESYLTPLVVAERRGVYICDYIRCFNHICGHIETKTSCHNMRHIEQRFHEKEENGEEEESPRLCPCHQLLCNQSVITTLYLDGACVQCQTRDDPNNPIRVLFDDDPTITRSDPQDDTISPDQLQWRRTFYRNHTTQTEDRIRALALRFDPHNLLFDDFRTERFNASAHEFVWHYRWPEINGLDAVDAELFYGALRALRAEEDRNGVPVKLRLYYSSDKFGETDLMARMEPTDPRLVGEQCVICQYDLLPEFRDTRRLPCGHVFHWTCISKWYYHRDKTCPYCRGKFRTVALPNFKAPP